MTVLWLLCAGLLAQDMIVSYRGVYEEHRVHNESFRVAKAMIPHTQRLVTASFDVPIEPDDEGKSLTRLLQENQDLIVNRLFRGGILLTDATLSGSAQTRTKTVITLPALPIRATIKGTFVSIAVLE